MICSLIPPTGKTLALKATGFMSNSKHIIDVLAKQCTNNGGPGDHEHASPQNGRSKQASIWPEKLCFAIFKGLRKQLLCDNAMYEGEIGTVCEDPVEKQFTQSLGDCDFIDDVSGKVLDENLVRKAREDERIGVNKHNVYTKVPIQEWFDKTGGPPISTKWVDVNKGDDVEPDYRSRWVGREFKGSDKNRDDLFAATPPTGGEM